MPQAGGAFQRRTRPLDCAALARAQAEGTFTYDRVEAQACLDAFLAEPCAVVRDADGPPERCKDAAAPAVLPGGDCWAGSVDRECIGGWCEMDLAACNAPGTCVAWLDEGASCAAGGRRVAGTSRDGSVCVVEAPVTVVGAGQPCAAPDVVRGVGLFCDGSQASPVCSAAPAPTDARPGPAPRGCRRGRRAVGCRP